MYPLQNKNVCAPSFFLSSRSDGSSDPLFFPSVFSVETKRGCLLDSSYPPPPFFWRRHLLLTLEEGGLRYFPYLVRLLCIALLRRLRQQGAFFLPLASRLDSFPLSEAPGPRVSAGNGLLTDGLFSLSLFPKTHSRAPRRAGGALIPTPRFFSLPIWNIRSHASSPPPKSLHDAF